MKKFNIFEDIEGIEFPAGRRGRVMYGENGKIDGEYFVQGYSVVYPGGGIPIHHHETIETYTILVGTGEITVDGETHTMAEWSRINNIPIARIKSRLHKGWNESKAVTLPKMNRWGFVNDSNSM